MELPLQLQIAIEDELTLQSNKRLAALAAKISKSYRAGIPSSDGRYIQLLVE